MENSGNIQQQIAQRIKDANNVLVTVSANPSVDQLASTIGLTLLLNKLGKHGTAVFSGRVPSTIEFLEPEKTLEKDTNSLRDFIIALDKAKADKLRYKVEDKLVKIFITPYRTSLSDKDLEFSQGDFNVDVVIALGVKQRDQLDQAIVTHGRILHDATVISINNDGAGDLGTMNWVDAQASSLCEMVVALVNLMQDANLLDGQMATAFLTGIVAETDRFSNEKTSSATMGISSKLMAAGANQQLIANKLKEELAVPDMAVAGESSKDQTDNGSGPDGSLRIDHPAKKTADSPTDGDGNTDGKVDEIHIDEHGTLIPVDESSKTEPEHDDVPENPKIVLNPPTLGGTLTANSNPEGLDPSTDAMTLPVVKSPLLSHDSPPAEQSPDLPLPTPPKPAELESKPEEAPIQEEEPEKQTLTELEKFVDSPHVTPQQDTKPEVTPSTEPNHDHEMVNAARDAVNQAISSVDSANPEPIAALNAQPMNLDLGNKPASNNVPAITIDESGTPNFGLPANLVPTTQPNDETKSPVSDPTAPPPVPPPMMPPSYGSQPAGTKPEDQNPLVPPVL